MKLKRTPRVKAFLGVVAALLLAFVLQPVAAFAGPQGAVYYKTDGHGTVTPEVYWPDGGAWKGFIIGIEQTDTTIPAVGDSVWAQPIDTFPTLGADPGWEFDYWEADHDVYVEWPYTDDNGGVYLRTVKAGTHITNETIGDMADSKVYVTGELTSVVTINFTAHFKEKSAEPDVDPDTDPVTPDDTTDDSTTVKPADSTKKAVPKTGDALPGVMAAVCAGGVLVAGTVLARKRFN